MASDITAGTLVPYMTDYPNKLAAIEAFRSGEDWVLKNFLSKWDNKPMSIRDCKAGDMIKLRYKKLRRVAFYVVTDADKLPKGR